MNRTGRTHINLNDLLQVRQQLHASELLGQKAGKSQLLGLHLSHLRGRSMEFDQVRSYQSGDDVRLIDWRVSARTGQLHSKVFQEEKEQPVFIVVEQSPAMCFASQGNFKSVQAAYIASLFAWSAQSNNDRVGGLVFSGNNLSEIRPQRHRRATFQLLGELVRANQALYSPMQPHTKNSLQQALARSRRLLKPDSSLVIICDERSIDPHTCTLLKNLAQRYNLLLIPVSDPMEHQLPPGKQLVFALQQGELSLNAHSTNSHTRWQQQAQACRQQWQKLAQQANIVVFFLSTASSVLQQLSRPHQPAGQN